MTRNCSDRRAAVNSRFSSNRTNKRFLLRVSCGRRKTRLCTVQDGGFPQPREGLLACTKVFDFSVYTARTKSHAVNRAAAQPAHGETPAVRPSSPIVSFISLSVFFFFRNPDDGTGRREPIIGISSRLFSLRRSVNAEKCSDSVYP